VLGNIQGYSWQSLADSVTDKSHIIHTALRLRRQAVISPSEEADFLKNLQAYLNFLEATYK